MTTCDHGHAEIPPPFLGKPRAPGCSRKNACRHRVVVVFQRKEKSTTQGPPSWLAGLSTLRYQAHTPHNTVGYNVRHLATLLVLVHLLFEELSFDRSCPSDLYAIGR